MQVLGDKVLIRFTKENKESIFSKVVTRDDGSKVKLFLNVDVDSGDERKSGLFVQTGIVEAVGEGIYCNTTGKFLPVVDIQIGDIAIVDYMLCNDLSKFFYKDGGDDIFWCNAITTYHQYDEIAYANRRTPRDTIIAKVGDIDTLSSIYGIIRNDELIARQPFVFLHHESNIIEKETKMKIIYTETQKTFTRKILACSEESKKRIGIENGEDVLVNDADIFSIIIENREIDCIFDSDILANASLTDNLKNNLSYLI